MVETKAIHVYDDRITRFLGGFALYGLVIFILLEFKILPLSGTTGILFFIFGVAVLAFFVSKGTKLEFYEDSLRVTSGTRMLVFRYDELTLSRQPGSNHWLKISVKDGNDKSLSWNVRNSSHKKRKITVYDWLYTKISGATPSV